MSKINFITDLEQLIEPRYTSEFETFVDNLLRLMYQQVYDTNHEHVMIDVGANVGAITKVLLRHINSESGKIIAIDAHPQWLKEFEFSDHPRVEKHNLGCYSYACERKFVAQEQLTGSGYFGLCPDKTYLDIGKLKSSLVKCEPLDDLISTDKQISFIKIDAESCDFEILLGSKNILTKHRPFVVFEFSGQILEKAHGHSRNDFFNFFKTHRYNLYSVGQGKSQDFIAESWDTFTCLSQDILAMPAEYNYLVENNNNIMEKNYEC
jgi:FkbM family methyltransferase